MLEMQSMRKKVDGNGKNSNWSQCSWIPFNWMLAPGCWEPSSAVLQMANVARSSAAGSFSLLMRCTALNAWGGGFDAWGLVITQVCNRHYQLAGSLHLAAHSAPDCTGWQLGELVRAADSISSLSGMPPTAAAVSRDVPAERRICRQHKEPEGESSQPPLGLCHTTWPHIVWSTFAEFL